MNELMPMEDASLMTNFVHSMCGQELIHLGESLAQYEINAMLVNSCLCAVGLSIIIWLEPMF